MSALHTLARVATTTALALAASLPAQALTFDGALTQGATVATDYSGTALLSFDLDLANMAPAVLTWRIDEDDLAGPIAFNAIVRNYTGQGLSGLVLALDLGSFASVGSINRQFGGDTHVSGSGATRTLQFTPEEYLDLELGDALGSTPGASNWTLATAGLNVGDRISLTVSAVPEPGSWALMLAGLLGVGTLARRRG